MDVGKIGTVGFLEREPYRVQSSTLFYPLSFGGWIFFWMKSDWKWNSGMEWTAKPKLTKANKKKRTLLLLFCFLIVFFSRHGLLVEAFFFFLLAIWAFHFSCLNEMDLVCYLLVVSLGWAFGGDQLHARQLHPKLYQYRYRRFVLENTNLNYDSSTHDYDFSAVLW